MWKLYGIESLKRNHKICMIHFCLCVYHQVLRLKFGVMNEHYFMSNRNFNRLQVYAMALWQGVEHQMFSTAHSTYLINNISNKQFYVVSCSHGCFHIVVVVVHKFILSKKKKQRTKHPSNKCWRSIKCTQTECVERY